MEQIDKKILKMTRKFYKKMFPENFKEGRNWKMFSNKDYANKLIYDTLMSDKPAMIGRFGSTEMACLINYLGIKQNNKSWISYVKGKSLMWWWNPNIVNQMQKWSGFFPPEKSKIEQFCELIMQDMRQVDILGSWLLEEELFSTEISQAKKVVLEDIEPFFSSFPWTRALENKRVLVIHPFAETILAQYDKRKELFDNDLLPDFQLRVIKAVQSVAGNNTEFNDWFDALNHMKNQVDREDYDIAIVGCGAYGFPLAAHIKRSGKKAVHLAGATQLLFGIKGKRWEEFIVWPYTNLFNEHWLRPSNNEKPKNANQVENACYW